MFRTVILGLGATALLATAALAQSKPTETSMKNPLLTPWAGAYGGVPAFDEVKVEYFKPALEAAMAEQLKESDAVANDPAPATFENTIAALERSGRTLDRVSTVYGVFSSTM